jgi:hypothetical protein
MSITVKVTCTGPVRYLAIPAPGTLMDLYYDEVGRPAAEHQVPAPDNDALTADIHHRTSWSLALRQADRAGVLDAQTRREWGQITPTRGEFMEAVGWAPQPDLEQVRVPPSYAHAVMEAWRRSLITGARAVEVMHGQISRTDLPPRDEVDVEP